MWHKEELPTSIPLPSRCKKNVPNHFQENALQFHTKFTLYGVYYFRFKPSTPHFPENGVPVFTFVDSDVQIIKEKSQLLAHFVSVAMKSEQAEKLVTRVKSVGRESVFTTQELWSKAGATSSHGATPKPPLARRQRSREDGDLASYRAKGWPSRMRGARWLWAEIRQTHHRQSLRLSLHSQS